MSDNDILKPHRDAIDQIDATVLDLLNQRAGHARTIGELKGGGVVYRPEREALVLRRIQDLNSSLSHQILSNEAVARLFREIMSECLAVERPLTIAYLGPEGTFTQLAAVKHFGHAAKTQACGTIDEAFRLVESKQADYVVAPIENSTEGAVGRTLDLLVTSPLTACGEVVLRIHHHLLRQTDNKEGIKKIYAHAQAMAQCHEWLNHHFDDEVARISVASNAEAARLASLEKDAVAIASQAAAERYDLCKLASNIEDEPNNTTRFLVLGYQKTTATGRDRTSLIISAPNKVGTMHSLLKPLADNGVSMTKLESRPSKMGLWEYVFFIDMMGHQQDEMVAKTLIDLEERAAFVKCIGSYPIAVL